MEAQKRESEGIARKKKGGRTPWTPDDSRDTLEGGNNSVVGD